MKRFLSLFCALSIILSISAAPAKLAELKEFTKGQPVSTVEKVDAHHSTKAQKIKKARKDASDFPIISEQPEGELFTFQRAGGNYYVSGNSAYRGTQSGTIDIVFAAENKVYFQNIISSRSDVSWVEGTLSADSTTITVALGQNLAYSATYDAAIVLSWGALGETAVAADPEITTATFAIEGDTISLQNSSSASFLTAFWSDDASWTGTGDYESVYTPYEAPELVVLPEGATVVEYTMNFEDRSGNASAKSVNVAVVENEVFFQGLSSFFEESWVVGTKVGNDITFAANQYVGTYTGYGDSYFFYNGETVFTYDEEADTYSATGNIFGVLADAYYDGYYTDPVLSKAKDADLDHPTEVAIVELLSCKYDDYYGDVVYKLANATSDTIFQFDIYLADSLIDVELGQIYTFENMEQSASYSFVQADESKLGFKSASFVKTAIGETDSIRIEATVVDGANNVYHFAFEGVIEVPTPVIVPEDLETAAYVFVGTDTYYEEEEKKFIQVGFDADTVYFQGLSSYIPDAWIKGVLATDGTVTLAPCFLGVYSSLFGDSELSFEGGSLLYDAEANKFTADEFTTVDADGYEWDEYADITITLFVEVAATPADPEFESFNYVDVTYPNVKFNIPLTGTNGEDLNPAKLSYIFFTEIDSVVAEFVLDPSEYEELTDSMTEIPYEFSDEWDIYNYVLYLYKTEEEVRTWSKFGIQSIYRGAGEEHKSNIVWFDVAEYWAQAEGIENIVLTEKIQKVIVDGAVYVIRDNKMFNVLGTQVR